MAFVYISYSREDRNVAASLAQYLSTIGVDAFLDTNLVAGQDFRREIYNRLEQADAVIVIWSPVSVQSDFVRDEAEFALRSNKLISVAVSSLLLDHLPLGMRHMHVIRLDARDGFPGLLEALVARGVISSVSGEKRNPIDVQEKPERAPKSEPSVDIARLDKAENDVFVAYSRLDAEFCGDLVLELRSQGLDVFYDQFIHAGDKWRAVIGSNIRNCPVFVIILSKDSLASREVENELNMAASHGRNLIPVRIDQTLLPDGFNLVLSGINIIDGSSRSKNRNREIAERARTLVALHAFDNRRTIRAEVSNASSISAKPAVLAQTAPITSGYGWVGIAVLTLSLAVSMVAANLILIGASTTANLSAVTIYGASLFFLGIPYGLVVVAAFLRVLRRT